MVSRVAGIALVGVGAVLLVRWTPSAYGVVDGLSVIVVLTTGTG